MKRSYLCFAAPVLALLAGCTHRPPVPDWQVEAAGAAERFTAAYLRGDDRVQAAEFARARAETSRTGDASQVARVELLRCALQAASVEPVGCPGFEPLRVDAAADEVAYADYLAGRPRGDAIAALPAAQRATAVAIAQGGAAPPLAAIDEPVARLVAAGVLLRAGQLRPSDTAAAVETASAQGWRRPLLAWLGVELRAAERAGDPAEAQRLRRRIDLVAPLPRR